MFLNSVSLICGTLLNHNNYTNHSLFDKPKCDRDLDQGLIQGAMMSNWALHEFVHL